MPKAYVLAQVTVNDPDEYKTYIRAAGRTLRDHGARVLAVTSEIETLDGGWQPGRMVVIEFDSKEQARAWYNSPGYREATEIRHRATDSGLILLEGLE